MKKIMFLLIVWMVAADSFAQKQTYDLVTHIPPKGWKKEVKESLISYSIVNKKSNSWCQIAIVKSTVSKGSIGQDFESEWQELVVKNYKTTGVPELNEVKEAEGWKIRAGGGQFTFNGGNAMAMLTTMSGFSRCVSIVAITNSEEYLKDIDALLSSVDLKKPGIAQTKNEPVRPAVADGFTFTTTNFDDGWTSTVQEDGVQVTKGNIKILIHYPDKNADAYHSQLLDGLKNAWNILVAPRYSSTVNVEFRPIYSWESIEFAEADAVEEATGKTVHVVLFKKNSSGGNGRFVEFITPDKNSFEQEFGKYHESAFGWEKMENMSGYNKFAIAHADLSGKWTSNSSATLQYVNVVTGLDAGMDTHASVQNFQFEPGSAYKWDISVANGPVGNIKFQSVKSSGKFSMQGNWQVNFSDIEGKRRTYNAHFSCIKGLRILWLDDQAFFKVK
jgi:hypothetical protein